MLDFRDEQIHSTRTGNNPSSLCAFQTVFNIAFAGSLRHNSVLLSSSVRPLSIDIARGIPALSCGAALCDKTPIYLFPESNRGLSPGENYGKEVSVADIQR
jgi:hypothetical protein